MQFKKSALWILAGLISVLILTLLANSTNVVPTPVKEMPSVSHPDSAKVRIQDSVVKAKDIRKAARNKSRTEIVAAIVNSGHVCGKFLTITALDAKQESYSVRCNDGNEYRMTFNQAEKKWSVLEKTTSDPALLPSGNGNSHYSGSSDSTPKTSDSLDLH